MFYYVNIPLQAWSLFINSSKNKILNMEVTKYGIDNSTPDLYT